MNLNLCAVFFLDASSSTFHVFSWGPNSFSWASTGSGCWKRKRNKKTWCQNHVWKYVEPVSSMETCHTLTTYKMTTVCNLLDFSTNTWKLNESSQSLNHQRLDIKRHDEVWWGESEGRKTEGPNLSQMEFQNPARLTLKLNGLGINRSFFLFFLA